MFKLWKLKKNKGQIFMAMGQPKPTRFCGLFGPMDHLYMWPIWPQPTWAKAKWVGVNQLDNFSINIKLHFVRDKGLLNKWYQIS